MVSYKVSSNDDVESRFFEFLVKFKMFLRNAINERANLCIRRMHVSCCCRYLIGTSQPS